MSDVSIRELKDGTFQVDLRLARHPLPHVVKGDFPTKESAELWRESPNGRSIIARIRERARKGA